MVTLRTAQDVLKNFYLDAIRDEIDVNTSPFLSMIEKTSANVTGKGVSKIFRIGMPNRVIAGTETGDLPAAIPTKYVTVNIPLKNLYGSLEISDKALRASANNEGAFVNLLNEEMQSLLKVAKYNFARMLFGDGVGKLATIISATGDCLNLDTLTGLHPGMYLDIYKGNTLVESGRRICYVDKEENIAAIEDANWSDGDIPSGSYIVMSGTVPNTELTGLKALFSEDELYNIDRGESYMTCYMESGVGNISELVIQKTIDEIEQAGHGKINMIICSRGVRRALIEYCRENRLAMPMIKIGDNPSVMSFNGIPVVAEDFCPEGTMYFLNTNDFKLCQLCDWQWMEGDDGNILQQVPGKPVYTATLVKYAELVCERPCGQGALFGITEV